MNSGDTSQSYTDLEYAFGEPVLDGPKENSTVVGKGHPAAFDPSDNPSNYIFGCQSRWRCHVTSVQHLRTVRGDAQMTKRLRIKDRAKWYGLATGTLFLIVTTYLRVKFVFDSANLAGPLLMAAIILAVLTLLFGLLSFPRWQAWIALAVSAYAFYLLLFTRLYGID